MPILSLFLPLNIHLLLGVLCFFICGILSSAFLWSYHCIYGGFALFFIISCAYSYKNKQVNTSAILLMCSLIIGHVRYHQQCTPYHRFYDYYQQISCNIQGVITNIVSIEQARTQQCITVHVNHIQHNNAPGLNTLWHPVNIYIQLYTSTDNNYQVADCVQINKISIKKPISQSFFNYLIKENITSTIFYTQSDWKLLNRPRFSLYRWIFNCKQNLFERLHKKIPSQSFALFSSLFLGNRTVYKKDIDTLADQFKQWGISHYLARSGLHLTIFAFTWHCIFRLLPCIYPIKQILLLILSIIYFIFSWSSISFLRAFYSFLFCIIDNLCHMNTYFLHTLTLVTIFVLALNPMQLFFLDFQLSFALTFGLAWISHLYQPNTI